MNRGMRLRTKFVWLALLNLAVLAALILITIRLELGREFQSFLMATAREKIVAVSRQVSADLESSDADKRDAILAQYSKTYGPEFALYDASGLRIAGPERTLPREVFERLSRVPGGPLRRTVPSIGQGPPPFLIEAAGEYWIGIRTLVAGAEGPNTQRATLLLVSPTLFSNPFFFDWQPWLMILSTAIVVTLLIWLPLVRGLTRDLGKMTTATAVIAEGQFDVLADTKRSDELGTLGRSINQMAARLRDHLRGQKRFLGDAAHELRSPLGRMQVALGILEQKVEPEAQSYIQDLQEDVEFLAGLTTELLTFARSEINQEKVVLKPVDLQPLVHRAIKMEAEGNAQVKVEVADSLKVMADENLLFRALANLLRNAVRYAGDSGPIEITAGQDASKRVTITVADHGPGVPDEFLEKLFTPFFRLDSARERSTGGTGLGLAIVRSCVEACGGTVHAENRNQGGAGLKMVLRLAGASL
jgi:two-component system sensor histidine kinase CpxA